MLYNSKEIDEETVNNSNTKTQLIIAPIMLLILGVVYFSAETDEASAAISEHKQNSNSHFIQISEATFGANCDGERTFRTIGDDGAVMPSRIINIKPNNMLKTVSKMCNNKSSCEFETSAKSIGHVDSGKCDKKLFVSYRCFQIDKLRKINARSQDNIEINCSSDKL